MQYRNLLKHIFTSFSLLLLSPLSLSLCQSAQQAQPAIPAEAEREENPAIAELISSVTTIKPGESFWVALKLTLRPGWHTYWRNPGDSGFATSLEWSVPQGFVVSPMKWLPPQRFERAGIVSYGYTNEAYHLVKIRPPSELPPGPVRLQAKASWLACNDSCTPGFVDLNLDLMVSPDASISSDHRALFEELLQELPANSIQNGTFKIIGDTLQVWFPKDLVKDKIIESVTFVPYDKEIIKYGTPRWKVKEDGLYVTVEKHQLERKAEPFKAILEVNDSQEKKIFSTTIRLDPESEEDIAKGIHEGDSFSSLLLFAFLGGLILNVMPCVFPVLSLKVMSIVREASQKRHLIFLNGVLYTVGVIVSFLALAGLLILVKAGGQSVGWGFQMQNPYFVFGMIDLLFFIGLSLSGLVYLPVLFGNLPIHGHSSERTGRLSNIWIGALAVLVATPCTAPFMGVAIGYAFTQPPATVFFIFLSLSLGFAFPFLMLCLFPPLLRLFPKPGFWMETFKELMAFPIYATVAWLLWVFVQQTGERGLLISLFSMILIYFAIWMTQKRKIESPSRKALFALCVAALAISPAWFLEKTPTYVQVRQQTYSEKSLNELRAQNKPVFFYATAAWCLTCKANELALKSNATDELFNKYDVALMEADWTNYSEEITEFLTKFGRSGVPLYIYFPPEGDPVILPQLLTESLIREAVAEK